MAKSIKQHQAEVAKFDQEYQSAIDDGMIPILPDGRLLGVYENGFGDIVDRDDPVERLRAQEEYECGDGRRGGVLMSNSATMLDYSQQKFTATPSGVGTEGLGYAVWGPGNNLPNAIFHASASMPWTASALDYLDRTTFGLGARITYTVSRYSGGTVTHEDMDYLDAEVYLKERILTLLSKLDAETSTQEDGDESPSSSEGENPYYPLPNPHVPTPNPQSSSYHAKYIAHLEKQLDEANAELERYFQDRAEIEQLLSENNMQHFLKKWIADTTRFGICFPIIELDNSKQGYNWSPKVRSFDVRDASVMRLEQRNPDNFLQIDYVYHCEKWRENASAALSVEDYVAFPCINAEHPLRDIRRAVKKNARSSITNRPHWWCFPCYKPTPTKPYYPQLPWWSIFPSQIYQYAATMIYDKATARKNSTMWGKILFINTAYLAQIFAQAGEKGKTPEGQQAIRKGIYDSVENFLKRRDNNGKLLVMDSYPSADEKQMIDSIRIVDVPRNEDVKASSAEVAEIVSLVSYSLSVNMNLIGSSPSLQNASTGTAQRELHLLKNGQLSPERVTFTDFFDNFVFRLNGYSPKFHVKLFYPTLTTLDNSKTGTVEQSD